ncbi:MAG: hypothetical protein SGI77_05450 [Pirellulaceae bacterium]|nr:hypothetical protein [Pirellulaceae bacterium]
MGSGTQNTAATAKKPTDQMSDKQELAQECSELQEDFQSLVEDVGTSVASYCRKRPAMAACMLFAIGFYVGWKVKPW